MLNNQKQLVSPNSDQSTAQKKVKESSVNDSVGPAYNVMKFAKDVKMAKERGISLKE